MDEIIKELDELGKTIARKEKELNQTEGAEAQLMKKLKDDFDIDTVEDAKEKLDNSGKTLKRLEDKIESDFTTLKEDYNW